ncbi:MAG TPA: class I SAM-dependent methyltransferase [Herpetosiphonaceae bacterium]|nr:class I SAM-dependent methyltransferase [Herpetosiphonaceae bacterium]
MSTSTLPLMPAIYGDYAAVYDRTGQMRFSILMELYLREVLERHPAPGPRMLDLACGTGTLALMMAEGGWEVVGIDAAWTMLEQARLKQGRAGVSVQFVEGDMRHFATPLRFDLVTCCYDSLNYLLDDDDLLHCFRSVFHALAPGGVFCFDLATEYFLETHWQGTESFEDAGYSQTMESSFDPATCRSSLVMHGRLREVEGGEREFSEVHMERAVHPNQVRTILLRAGLIPEAVYDCFTFQEPSDRSLRHFWVARKPREHGPDNLQPHA